MKLVHNNEAKPFYLEGDAFEGVRRIAGKVCEDIRKVTGILPELLTYEEGVGTGGVLVATVGHSPALEKLEKDGKLFVACDVGIFFSA